MGFMAVPADGSCHMPCAGIAFRMSPTTGELPSHRAAFEFCSDMLLSRAGGCREKTNTKKLMLSIFSEINFFLIYTKLFLMHNLLKYSQIHSSNQPP